MKSQQVNQISSDHICAFYQKYYHICAFYPKTTIFAHSIKKPRYLRILPKKEAYLRILPKNHHICAFLFSISFKHVVVMTIENLSRRYRYRVSENSLFARIWLNSTEVEHVHKLKQALSKRKDIFSFRDKLIKPKSHLSPLFAAVSMLPWPDQFLL